MLDDLKFLKGLIERKIEEESFSEGEMVGIISKEVEAKFKKLDKVREHFRQDVKLRNAQYQLEIERKMEEEFDVRKEEIEKLHKEIWNQIYEECFLDNKKKYYREDDKIYMYLED